MSEKMFFVIYVLLYIIMILYFVMLGCYMLMRRDDFLATRGEQVAKKRITCTMGVTMWLLAVLWFLYLPPILYGYPAGHLAYQLIYLLSLMSLTPMVYVVMFAVVQRRVHIGRWVGGLSVPFVLLIIWKLLALDSLMPLYVGAALSVCGFLYLFIRFTGEYRRYISRIRSEYSDTSCHEIVWAWVCFSGLAMQGIVFSVYMFVWSPVLELVYMVITVVNATCLCYCACHQRTIDLDVVEENNDEEDEIESGCSLEDEHTFYADVEERLKTLCEQKLLYLDPDITRETLCLRLAINRTYLGMYFHSRNLTFYHYINTLRVEYAYRLMQDNPHLSIRKVSEQSGFRSVTTFRKVFQEVMGCLPSEIKTKKIDN